jgi:hypothetical protein
MVLRAQLLSDSEFSRQATLKPEIRATMDTSSHRPCIRCI